MLDESDINSKQFRRREAAGKYLNGDLPLEDLQSIEKANTVDYASTVSALSGLYTSTGSSTNALLEKTEEATDK